MDKTFNATEAEPRITKAWAEAKAFAAGANAKPGAQTFSIVIPPPNVTGNLHMGHAFNNTLQDILTRWHRMQGHDTLWQPGTDHAGIATQMVVERELAKTNRRRTDFARDEFLDLVWEQKKKSRSNIRNQLERLGASCDWDREAFTMAGAPGDPGDTPGGQNFHDAVIRVFVDMYEKGLIYRGKRLVNWDPHFETAISDLEVESTEVDGHMWHFKYPLAGGATYEYVERDEDGNEVLRETRDYISIATTRPETMLGDGAVAVNPRDERYAPIVGKLCEIPVGPKEHRRLIPIITDPYPDPEFGSGAVKITGAHDFNDYEVAKRGGIPMYRLMDTRGAMRDDGAPYTEAADLAMAVAKGERELGEAECDTINLVPDDLRGLDRFEARKRVVEQITSEGLAVMTTGDDERLGKSAADPEGGDKRVPLVEAKKIMQPFGDRSKVVIEPMLTDQWFVDAEKIVGPAIDSVRDGTVQILPEQDKKVYFNWLENIEPWCISRQLWWGHQIPVWYGPDGERFCAENFELAVEAAEEHYLALNEDSALGEALGESILQYDSVSVSALDEADTMAVGTETSGRKFPQSSVSSFMSGGDDGGYADITVYLARDPDVLDTWFSSGLWPIGTLGWPEETDELKKYFPTSVLVTGFDIIFFWVARMMMMQYAVVEKHPFDTVYVHALVRDEKGKKMSKSLGNVLDPLDLVDEYGADAVRFTLASMAAMGRDLKLSTQRIAGYRNFGTKLWNAASYGDFKGTFALPHADAPPAPTLAITKWILGELAKTRQAVDEALEAFRFNDAANALYAFVWGTFCDRYLEFTKPVLDGDDAAQADETRATYAWAFDQCLILLHPFMPFITEELWGMKQRPKMLAHADWPTYGTEMIDAQADQEINWTIQLIDNIRSARQQVNVPASAKVTLATVAADDASRAALSANTALVERIARIGDFTDLAEAPKGALAVTAPGATFAVPVADLIDVAAERGRLEKSLGKLDKELGGLRGRLNNPKFRESAPDEVVEETEAQLAAKEEEHAKISAALANLRDAA